MEWIEIIGHTLVIIAIAISAGIVVAWKQRLCRTTRRGRFLYRVILGLSFFAILANIIHPLAALSGILNRANAAHNWGAVCEFISMIGQAAIVAALVGLKVRSAREPGRSRRILVIGAHPDDPEIACGGTLARWRDEGHILHGLVLSRGERGGRGQIRPTEARRSAQFLGLDTVTVLDFPDTRFREVELEIMHAIESEIAHFRPDVILTHSAHDIHQDHQTVHTATLRAARNVSTVLAYESPSASLDFRPSLFVDVGEYLDIKIEGIREHHDQADKPYVASERVRGIAAFRGGQVKTRHAEGFEVVRALVEDLPAYAVSVPAKATEPASSSASALFPYHSAVTSGLTPLLALSPKNTMENTI